MSTDPLDFLQAVTGFARDQDTGRDTKLAKIDPAYVSTSYPATLPRVTFEGESALSAKRYAVLSPYRPMPGDRVLMIPSGQTYVIAGAAGWTPPSLPIQVENGTDQTGITSASASAGSPVVGTSFVAPASGRVWISISGNLFVGTATGELVLGWELRDGSAIGSGTVLLGNDADRALTAGRTASTQAGGTNRYLHTGLTGGSSYNVRAMHWINGGTGIVTYRRIAVEAA